MPTYEYQCTKCAHSVEVFQKISDEPLKICPKCNQSSLDKVISASGFQLKGTGWYVTDYSNKGKAKDEKGSSAPPATDAKKDNSSSSNSTGTKTS